MSPIATDTENANSNDRLVTMVDQPAKPAIGSPWLEQEVAALDRCARLDDVDDDERADSGAGESRDAMAWLRTGWTEPCRRSGGGSAGGSACAAEGAARARRYAGAARMFLAIDAALAEMDWCQFEKNACTSSSSCTIGAGGSEVMK